MFDRLTNLLALGRRVVRFSGGGGGLKDVEEEASGGADRLVRDRPEVWLIPTTAAG